MSSTPELLEQAAEWRLLGLLFECPGEAWRHEVAAVAREIHNPELREAAASALSEASEGLYHSLFGPGGPAPPREASYQSTLQLGYLLAEISAYYEAFAYQPRTPETPDHVAVECGFISYLGLKQAYARERGDAEAAAVAEDAAERFLREHLANIAGPLAGSLEASGVAYLAKAGAALSRALATEQPR